MTNRLILKNKGILLSYLAQLFFFLFASQIFVSLTAQAQEQIKATVVDSTDDPRYRTVIAGTHYGASGMYRFFWGSNYRNEWTTPVKVPIINFDTVTIIGIDSVASELTPTETGGGKQTKSLRLRERGGREYVLRLVQKDLHGVLPPEFRGTFLQDIAQDQLSIAHPYAALTIPKLSKAAGILHTNPSIVYVPYSNKLGQFNEEFGNTLCLFEERANEGGEPMPAFGNAEDILSTENMLKNLLDSSSHRVDYKAYIKARIFDMLIGDWDRHEDQWRWAKLVEGDKTIYKPIPRDRDQAYTKKDGFLTRLIGSAEKLEGLENFRGRVKNVRKFNGPAVFLDRQLTNEAPLQVWIEAAKELQQSITDAVIDSAVRHLPPEVYTISGERIINNLKSRRGFLLDDAAKYYNYLNDEVDITGTQKAELFEVKHNSNTETTVNLYDMSKGMINNTPFYSRTFNADETDEIRLYGLAGNDKYNIDGTQNHAIRIRIVGGVDKDSILATTSRKTWIYDNPEDNIHQASGARYRFAIDTLINAFQPRGFRPNSGSTIKAGGINVEKGVYLSTGYKYQRAKWRQEPFAWRQAIKLDFSLTQLSLGVGYSGLFNQAIGKWNLNIDAEYYPTYTLNYAGVGNETELINDTRRFYHLHRRNGFATVELSRELGSHHSLGFSVFYQGMKFIDDDERYISQVYPNKDPFFDLKQFGGAQVRYLLSYLNNAVLPTKGFQWSSSVAYTQNLKQTDRSFMRYTSGIGFYLPLGGKLSLAVKANASTVSGEPEFFQLSWLGNSDNLRGFRKYRFWGKTAFYNGNELRFIVPTRNYFFSGKIGLIALLDNGRVWNPDEDSKIWHHGYGGGILISPFNRVAIVGTYAQSKEEGRFNVRLARFF